MVQASTKESSFVAVLATIAAAGACSYAAGKGARAAEARSRMAEMVAVVAIAAGPALCVSRRMLGPSGTSLAEDWVRPVLATRAVDVATTHAIALALLTLGTMSACYAAGWRRARVVADATRADDRAASAYAERALFGAASFATSLDRWVVAPVSAAAIGGARAIAWVAARADDELVAAPLGLVLGAFAAIVALVLYSVLAS
jgi:hypothetical protein